MNDTPVSQQGYGHDHASPFGYSLHHVQVVGPIGGEDQARAFYVDVLGMTEIEKPPVLAARGGIWVRADGVELHVSVDADFRPAHRAHPGIRVTALDALAERLRSNGVEVDWDGNFPGHRRFYARDPFGNRLEFIQRDESVPATW